MATKLPAGSGKYLPIIATTGIVVSIGVIRSSKPKKVPSLILGGVFLLILLTILDQVSSTLANAFAVLVLIKALLDWGPIAFGKF